MTKPANNVREPGRAALRVKARGYIVRNAAPQENAPIVMVQEYVRDVMAKRVKNA